MFSILSLLDDIASTFDDVATMSKIAVEKTSVLMSDDLAVNAGVITGVHASRELPMVKAIFIGSLFNKVYCIIGTLSLLSIYPPLLTIILFIGGLYLSYEGAHKVFEKFFSQKENQKLRKEVPEEQKVKGAIKTDLILSIEIIVIAQSSISGPLVEQILSLSIVGLAASVIIYGLVAILVKIDDVGVLFIEKGKIKLGQMLVNLMPFLMKGLGIIGTIAMFLVGGGIINHTFHLQLISFELIQNLIMGLLAGTLLVAAAHLFLKIKN